MDIQDLAHTDGADNTAGMQQEVLMIKLSDIATLPKPDVDDSTSLTGTLDQLVTISGNIIMKANKVAKKIYVTLETGAITCALQGPMDGKSYKNSVTFHHPGSSAQLLGLAQYAKNGDLIILAPEADGQVRVIGHAGFPAKLEAGSLNTGAKSTDDKAGIFTFYSVRKGPAPIFKGQIQLNIAGGSGAVDANSNSNQDVVYIPGS